MIWTPDLLLYNSANENFDSKYPSNIIIYNNGKVEQIPPGYNSINENNKFW